MDQQFKRQTEELLEKLIAIPSEYFQEEEIMSFVHDWFTKAGISSRIHAYHEAKVTGFRGKNVIAGLVGTAEGPTICLNGHLDTVKPAKGWTKDPYGQREGNLLYGIGSLDMKSGCAASMMAVKRFAEEVKSFRGKILSTYVSVEEGPYGMGTNALIEEGYLEGVDYSIITEPSAGFTGNPFPDLCLGARGGYGLSVEFYGKAAHAATPHLGVSAAEDAATFIQGLQNIRYPEDDKLGRGTACVVAIQSDGGACSVPDHAVVTLFWHIVRGESPATIEQEIRRVIEGSDIHSRWQIRFREAPSEDSKGFMPYAIDGKDPLTIGFCDTVRQVTGKDPGFSYFQSIGDFNYLGTRLGAPAIIFGGAGKNFHSPDEYVELDTVTQTAEIVFRFLKETLEIK